MGAVFSAIDLHTDDQLAVKILPANLAERRGFRDRFFSEIETLRRLDHENIVQFHAYGYDEGQDTLYYGMEYVAGQTLDRIIKSGYRFEWRELLDVTRQICRALRHAHDRGVIHRDLKPGNLMVSPQGVIKLADFGIAKLYGNEGLTVAGTPIGTASYMSPEQAEGDRVTERSDLYSLGCVLYAMLSGRPPFLAKSVPAMMRKQVFDLPDPVTMHAPSAPAELEVVIKNLLAKEVANRPANAGVLMRLLDRTSDAIALRERQEGHLESQADHMDDRSFDDARSALAAPTLPLGYDPLGATADEVDDADHRQRPTVRDESGRRGETDVEDTISTEEARGRHARAHTADTHTDRDAENAGRAGDVDDAGAGTPASRNRGGTPVELPFDPLAPTVADGDSRYQRPDAGDVDLTLPSESGLSQLKAGHTDVDDTLDVGSYELADENRAAAGPNASSPSGSSASSDASEADGSPKSPDTHTPDADQTLARTSTLRDRTRRPGKGDATTPSMEVSDPDFTYGSQEYSAPASRMARAPQPSQDSAQPVARPVDRGEVRAPSTFHVTAAEAEERDRLREAEERRGRPLIIPTSTVASLVAVALLAAAAWWFFKPPSADALHHSIVTLYAGGEASNLDMDKADAHCRTFFELYADDPRAAELQIIKADIDLFQTERKLIVRGRRMGEFRYSPKSEVERLLLESLNLASVDSERAHRQLSAIIDLYGSVELDADDAGYVELARRQVARLSQEISDHRMSMIVLVKDRMAQIELLRETDPQAARQLSAAVVELFHDKTWARRYVDRAAALLVTLEPDVDATAADRADGPLVDGMRKVSAPEVQVVSEVDAAAQGDIDPSIAAPMNDVPLGAASFTASAAESTNESANQAGDAD